MEATDALFQAQNTQDNSGEDGNDGSDGSEDCCGNKNDTANTKPSATNNTTGTSSDSHAHSNTPAKSENSDANSDTKNTAAQYKPAISTPKITTADGFMALALQSLNALDPNSSRAANYRTYIHQRPAR